MGGCCQTRNIHYAPVWWKSLRPHLHDHLINFHSSLDSYALHSRVRVVPCARRNDWSSFNTLTVGAHISKLFEIQRSFHSHFMIQRWISNEGKWILSWKKNTYVHLITTIPFLTVPPATTLTLLLISHMVQIATASMFMKTASRLYQPPLPGGK